MLTSAPLVLPPDATHEVFPDPSVCRTFVFDPFVAGSWNTVPVPAAAATRRATLPLVDPLKVTCPPVPLLAPNVNVVPVATPSVGVTNVGEVARTTEPVPVTAVMEVPLILKEFPVPAVSYVLLVKVSVVALPTRVSVAAGRLTLTAPSAPVTVWSVTVPDVAFPKASVPGVPDAPKVGVAVNAGDAPANIWPAAPVMETAPAALTATGAVPLIAPPPLEVTHVAQVMLPVAVVIANGELAVTAGVPLEVPAVQVGVPAAACGAIVSAPEDEPSRMTLPIVELACPSVRTPDEIFALAFPDIVVPEEP